MKKIIALLSAAFTYFCVATVIALVAAAAALSFKGALDRGRLYRVLAALHGIDLVTVQQQLTAREAEVDNEQPSHEDRFQQLALKNLDLDLREDAIRNAWSDMNNLQAALAVERARFDELKDAYAVKLQQLADEEQATSLKEVQRTLEAIKPAQAKEQILKMLDDDAMDDVVTILKNMPIDKRKRIIAEFEQATEVEALYEILKNVRLGEPITSQIRDTQEKLNEFGSSQ